MLSSRSRPSSRSSAVGTASTCTAQSHHRQGDVGLDADDDGLRAAQPCDLCDGAQGVAGEGVDDVECRDVDDDAAGPVLSDLVEQVAAEAQRAARRRVPCGWTR